VFQLELGAKSAKEFTFADAQELVVAKSAEEFTSVDAQELAANVTQPGNL